MGWEIFHVRMTRYPITRLKLLDHEHLETSTHLLRYKSIMCITLHELPDYCIEHHSEQVDVIMSIIIGVM